MDHLTDQQLLREYAADHSEAAFGELVRRHINLVYSAALRTVGDAHQAQDVTQSAFIALAQQAPRLTDRPVLSGWLYSTAQRLAAKVVRSEVRRRNREQEASTMNKLLSTESKVSWESIEPHFDQALNRLSEAERDALLLRFFQGKSAREMARILHISDAAAQKRVDRAVERLRGYFLKRGIALGGASGLTMLISNHAIQAVPPGLATTVTSAAAIAGNALHTSTLIAATKTIAMTTAQKSVIAVACIVVTATGIYEAQRVSALQQRLQTVQQQRDSLSEQVARLQTERDEAATARVAANHEISDAQGPPTELLRLRAEIAKLRRDAETGAQGKAAEGNDPGATAKSWLTRVDQLKKFLERSPEKAIPELQLLSMKDWLDAVKDAEALETDADFLQALRTLRDSGKTLFGDLARNALTKYAAANGGLLPSDWRELAPYFDKPVDDAIFQRYALLQTGKLSDVSSEAFLFAEKAKPVDDEYDSFYEYRMNATRSSSVNPTRNALEQATLEFAAAHNGLLPTSPSQLEPYSPRPIDPAEAQKLLDKIPPGVTTLDQLKAVGTLREPQTPRR